jgi:hypothetical protein
VLPKPRHSPFHSLQAQLSEPRIYDSSDAIPNSMLNLALGLKLKLKLKKDQMEYQLIKQMVNLIVELL